MHLTDRCRFLNCSVRMGGGENKRGGRVGRPLQDEEGAVIGGRQMVEHVRLSALAHDGPGAGLPEVEEELECCGGLSVVLFCLLTVVEGRTGRTTVADLRR